MNILAKGDPVPLDFLLQSNLTQQQLASLRFNSKSMLNKTMNVKSDVMCKVRDMLDRDVKRRQNHEWAETMGRMTVTEKTQIQQVVMRDN